MLGVTKAGLASYTAVNHNAPWVTSFLLLGVFGESSSPGQRRLSSGPPDRGGDGDSDSCRVGSTQNALGIISKCSYMSPEAVSILIPILQMINQARNLDSWFWTLGFRFLQGTTIHSLIFTVKPNTLVRV